MWAAAPSRGRRRPEHDDRDKDIEPRCVAPDYPGHTVIRAGREFKSKVVLGVLTGAQSPAEACRKHALSPNLLTLWKTTFLERAHTLFQPDDQRDEDQARIAELEQLLGRSTRQIEILKKASTLLDAASIRNGI